MIPERYKRIARLVDLTESDLDKLQHARVALVGCGALGGGYAIQLVRLGIGFLRLIDRDIVEEHNLSTQLLFNEADLSEPIPKVRAARRYLRSINSGCEIDARPSELTPETAKELLGDVDIIIDATDNFETRFLINDVAVKYKVPWIYTGVISYTAVSMAIVPGKTACLACIMEKPPATGVLETCETAGIWPSVSLAISGTGVTEVLRLLTGRDPQYGFTEMDFVEGHWKHLYPARKSGCPVCSGGQFYYLTRTRGADTVKLCGREMVHISPRDELDLNLESIAEKMPQGLDVMTTNDLLHLKVNEGEIYLFRDGRAFIKGVSDTARARSIYNRYFSG